MLFVFNMRNSFNSVSTLDPVGASSVKPFGKIFGVQNVGSLVVGELVLEELMVLVSRTAHKMLVFNLKQFLQSIGLQYLLNRKRPQFRCSQVVKPVAKLVAVALGEILLNLISNRISDIEQFEHISDFMILVRSVPMSFIHYRLLSITTLIVLAISEWVGNKISMESKDTESPPQNVPPLDSQVIGPHPPQDTRLSHPQDTGPPHLIGQPQLQVIGPPCLPATGLATGLVHSQVLGASHPNATEQPQPQGTGHPHPQVTGSADTQPASHPQGRGSADSQAAGASHPQTTGPLDLGILDHDLRGFFYHLKQHYRLPAPTMSTSSSITSISYAQTSSGTMALTVHITEVDVTDVELVFKPDLTLPSGSKVFYRTFEMGPQTGIFEMEDFRKMVLESLNRARKLDPECTLQFGSFAVLKYTESGLKWWRLKQHWIPTISDIRLSSWNLFHSLRGSRRQWIIKGFNLQAAIMKSSTVDEIENVKVFRRSKMESGEDVLFFEEPDLVQNSAPMFRKEVYICASNSVEVEEGVIFNVQSEPINVKRAYWIFVIKSLIPSRWTVIIILGLSVLQDLTYGPLGIMHDSLSSKLAQGHVGLPHDDDVNIVENLTRKSILLHILSEIYNFLLVFIVVIVTPIFVSTTFGQLSRQQIRQLGSYLLGLWRTHALKDTSNFPSPTLTIPTASSSSVQDNLTEPLMDYGREEAGDVSGTGHGGGGQELYNKHVLDGSLTIPVKESGGPVRGPQYDRNIPGLLMMDSTNIQDENKERTISVEDVDTVDKTGHSAFLKQRQDPFDSLNEEISGDGASQDIQQENSSTGPMQTPSGYNVASNFPDSTGYESIEKETNAEEHESPYPDEDESKNVTIGPIEGGLGDICVPPIAPLSEKFGDTPLNRLEKTMAHIEDEDKSKSVLDHSISGSDSDVDQDNNDDRSGQVDVKPTSESSAGGPDPAQQQQAQNDRGRAASTSSVPTENGGAEQRIKTEWRQQDEPGVYLTLTALPGGGNDLKRVRFSRKVFSERQAEEWWADSRQRVHEQYNVRRLDKQNSGSCASDVSGTGHGAGGQELYNKHVLDGSLTIPVKESGGPVRGPQYDRNIPGLLMMDSTNIQDENKERTISVEDVDTVDKTGHSALLKQRQNPFDILNDEISGDGALQDIQQDNSSTGPMQTPSGYNAASNFPNSTGYESIEKKTNAENGGAEQRLETEWVEHDEPGVYITLTALPGGGNDLKRVRFSRKVFSERQAEQWWADNRERVLERYNARLLDTQNSG